MRTTSLLILLAACGAQAQTTTPFSIKAGGFASTNDTEARLALGAEWMFNPTPTGGFSLSADYELGVFGRSVPICLNAVARRGAFFGAFGVGASWNDESPLFGQTRRSVDLAFRAAVGADLGRGPAFIELAYHWSGSRDHSGVTLMFGLRF